MMSPSPRKLQIIRGHKPGALIIVPASEKGRGGGHLCRCISLTSDLRTAGRQAWLFITPQTRDLTTLYKSMGFNPSWCITDEELKIRNEKLGEAFGFVVLDYFQTPHDELLRWKKIAPVIGIDEGGSCRERFDFLIDILIPEKLANPPANISSAGLLKFPELNKDQRIRADSPVKILVTFGQEDSAGLGLKIARELSEIKSKCAMEITLLRGALAENREQLPENVCVLHAIPQLAEHLGEYDLVITHYGITAYEALYAGTRVLLAHPTSYHKKLSKAAGFCTFTKKNFKPHSYTELRAKSGNSVRHSVSLCGLDKNKDVIGRRCEALAEKFKLRENTGLSGLINSFSPQVNRFCPVCGAEDRRSISRLNDRTYHRCSKCGVIYMDRINPAPIEYEREYFFESYRRQYGKTYLEDFDNIKKAAKRRLKIISKFILQAGNRYSEKPALLDIGCAYGPFLATAKEEGFSPVGIDPAEDAVKYVQEKLGIPAVNGFFPHSTLYSKGYDVITLWFVMEHFTDCITVLAEIRKLLKPGGILAFSTPSFSGISGRSSLRRFLSASPADHWTVWSPKMCKKALALAGFKVKKIVVTGRHPQRFPLLGRFAKSRKNPVYWVLLAISKILGLGDTFEVYAQGGHCLYREQF